jgi:hypothetical protein
MPDATIGHSSPQDDPSTAQLFLSGQLPAIHDINPMLKIHSLFDGSVAQFDRNRPVPTLAHNPSFLVTCGPVDYNSKVP